MMTKLKGVARPARSIYLYVLWFEMWYTFTLREYF